MHTDPISDMLTRIRNGSRARLERVDIPRSNIKVHIAEILKKEGYISDFREIAGKTPGQSLLEVKLRYDSKRDPVILGINRVSSPGMRQYSTVEDIPKVRSGLGTMILTTSKGLMTDKQARDEGIGGEMLCAVW